MHQFGDLSNNMVRPEELAQSKVVETTFFGFTEVAKVFKYLNTFFSPLGMHLFKFWNDYYVKWYNSDTTICNAVTVHIFFD